MVDDRGNIVNYKSPIKTYTLLDDSNRELELNRKFDCRFTGPLNNSWIGTYYIEEFAKKRMRLLENNRYDNQTEFEWFCYSHLASFNMCFKMKNLGFNFDWDNYINDKGYFYHKNTIEDTRLEFCRHVNLYGREELFIDFSEEHDYSFCLSYNKLDLKNNKGILFLSSIYQFIKWLIEKELITIIDKGDYIMFYKNNGDKVKLQRTPDNDIEWRLDDFKVAVDRIFNII